MIITIVGDAFTRLLEELPPVQEEAMKPRWLATGLEYLGILVSILLLHGGESRGAQVGKMLPKSTAMRLLGLCVTTHRVDHDV